MERTSWWFALTAAYGPGVIGRRAPGAQPERSFEELVARADAIVLGRCQKSASVWRGRSLFTRYGFRIEQQLAGECQREISVLVPGGVDLRRKNPVAMSIPEAPSFLPGDSVVLMLVRIDPEDYGILGLSQGCFELQGGKVQPLRRGQPARERPQSWSQFRQQLADALRAARFQQRR